MEPAIKPKSTLASDITGGVTYRRIGITHRKISVLTQAHRKDTQHCTGAPVNSVVSLHLIMPDFFNVSINFHPWGGIKPSTLSNLA